MYVLHFQILYYIELVWNPELELGIQKPFSLKSRQASAPYHDEIVPFVLAHHR